MSKPCPIQRRRAERTCHAPSLWMSLAWERGKDIFDLSWSCHTPTTLMHTREIWSVGAFGHRTSCPWFELHLVVRVPTNAQSLRTYSYILVPKMCVVVGCVFPTLAKLWFKSLFDCSKEKHAFIGWSIVQEGWLNVETLIPSVQS